MIPWLRPGDPFPPLHKALDYPNGLLAAGGDLSLPRLIDAYRRGIFPWFSDGEPILWWSPNPRMVLFPDELRVSRSLSKRLRRHDYEIRADSAFTAVMEGCAAPRQGQSGTWITAPMMDAYARLHAAGYAHSVETWMTGELVGGLYGVAIGGVFYGESMFARVTDASKIAFVHLVQQLRRKNFGLIDCQMQTAHLASLGAREISRANFTSRLRELLNYPNVPGPWHLTDDASG
ncbi:MAG TPA: leucyl/phenylalanyl-tRNA--protein transferase [Burkholderiales bacterium]|nr:leucyl/phenylalanyl-tRNA--protein transferase [Betaproteobacteria bacterium]HQR53819.1 leucyl/phenylalanyl-tRNA--protein transferase [Burkholderiales bacterium]